MDLAQSPKVSVRSGQGVGKTGLESVVVIWFLCCRPNQKLFVQLLQRNSYLQYFGPKY